MISIIVPIYNVEGYLSHCIDSILNSTYQDFELILVDDGSTDNCGAICDSYSEKDHRIRVIHQDNVGVSASRNTGMKMATGDYIMFVDGDDIVHSKMMEILFNAINSGDFDFAMTYAVKVNKGYPLELLVDKPITDVKSVILNQREYMEKLQAVSMQYHSVCNKLYKRSLIKCVQFNKTGAEDLEWNNRMCLKMNHAILVEAELYYYVQRANSEMHSGVTSLFVDRINSVSLCLDAIPKENQYYRALCLKFLYSMISYVRYNSRKSPLYNIALTNGRNAYLKTRSEMWASPYISWRKKIRIWCNYRLSWAYNTTMDLINIIKGNRRLNLLLN